MYRSRFGRFGKFALIALVAIPLVLAGLGYAVMSLWNWLLPPLVGWPVLGFGQAIALLVLCRLLFGGLRHHGGGGHWRHRIRERWESMTPEERERFRSRAGHGCHHRAPGADDAAA